MEGINDELALDAKITYEIEVNEKENTTNTTCSLQRNKLAINQKKVRFENNFKADFF
jgi:hypothetical protein